MSALPSFSPLFEDPSESENLGKISNFLGILTSDYGHFLPKKLLEMYPNASELAEMLGLQRTQVYAKKLPLKKGSPLRKRIINLVIASDLASILMEKDADKICQWLTAPNFMLFGESPLEVIMRGEGEPLILWLRERAGFKPGAAF